MKSNRRCEQDSLSLKLDNTTYIIYDEICKCLT